MERDVERVIERRVLGIEEIEAPLDALLHDRSRQRLVDREPVSIAPERPGAFGPDVDGERRHRVQKERLDVVAGNDRDRVGAKRLEPSLHPCEGGVHAQDEVAILRPRPRQELGCMGAGERADQHRLSLGPSRGDSPHDLVEREVGERPHLFACERLEWAARRPRRRPPPGGGGGRALCGHRRVSRATMSSKALSASARTSSRVSGWIGCATTTVL